MDELPQVDRALQALAQTLDAGARLVKSESDRPFKARRRGYDYDEVDRFFRRVWRGAS